MNQNNVVNTSPFLRTTREFPFHDMKELAFEVNKSYLDTATVVNTRTIGLFPRTRPAITGEEWFIQGAQKQQTFRQVYTFTNTSPIPHFINFPNIYGFSRMYGQYTNGTNWYGIISGTSAGAGIAGQLVFYLTPTNITFITGGGTMPAVSSGIIVLEWLSNI
jgi:hypothetical protein